MKNINISTYGRYSTVLPYTEFLQFHFLITDGSARNPLMKNKLPKGPLKLKNHNTKDKKTNLNRYKEFMWLLVLCNLYLNKNINN